MYTIMSVIYGVPLTRSCQKIIDEFEKDLTTEDWFEDEEGTCGFQMMYSGFADGTPGFCGVELWSAPCIGPIDMREAKYRMSPTREDKVLAAKKFKALHKRLQKSLIDGGFPLGIYIIFSTS